MKYKLLKDINGSEAGTIFNSILNYDRTHVTWIELIEWKSVWNILDLTRCFSLDNKEWFEEIKEVKSIYNTVIWDLFYIYWHRVLSYTELNGIKKPYYWDLIWESIKLWDAFLTKEEAETELSKRKAIQAIKKWSWKNDPKNINNWGWYMRLDINWDRLVLSEVVMYKIAGVQYYSTSDIVIRALIELEDEYKILFDIK